MLKKENVLLKCGIFALLTLSFSSAFGVSLSPNGYSGLGLVPSSSSLPAGASMLAYDPIIPGKLINKGTNVQLGFGLLDELELVGRLATNDQKCNMFRVNDCPPGTYRDFSSSFKWTPKSEWLKQNNLSVAIGATDLGGAATYFRSYYILGSKTWGSLEVSLGKSSGRVETAMLDGNIASATWKPFSWVNLSLQRVGATSSFHMLLQRPILDNGTNAWMTFNQRIGDSQVIEKNWIGWGVSLPIDLVNSKSHSNSSISNEAIIKKDENTKDLLLINPSEIIKTLEKKGFYKSKLGIKSNGVVVIEIENTAYLWNILDAGGVALGVISAAYASESSEQNFELIVTNKGIKQLKIIGGAKCVGLWLSKGVPCGSLNVQSLLQSYDNEATEDAIQWDTASSWLFRPEIILSPAIVSAIGTEYGALDLDAGANINLALPIWKGAAIEINRIEPLGLGTRQFEQGGAFFGAHLKGVTNRRLLHQLINLPFINSQARMSVGSAYTSWDGKQIETNTQSGSGRHKFGYTGGSFKNDSIQYNNVKNYQLLNYRFIHNDQQTAVTEITQGKFWGGDKGFSINQRYWYGDTTLNVYFRRSRMGDGQPLVSFAGLQFAIPFTPRENKSLEHLGLRGVSQWTYSLETKVLDKDNTITGGYGEVPRVGESLITLFNRDRNSTRYYDTNLARMRHAFLNLGVN